jgi:hypothetical protein
MSHKISSSALFEVINRKANNKGADFTIKSIKTGKDYTYKISRSQYKDNWYTHIKVETEYLKFVRLGTYYNGAIRHKGELVNTPSAIAIAYVLAKVELMVFNALDNQIDIMHTGNCLVCGKTLTDANSIEIGLGPICRGGK